MVRQYFHMWSIIKLWLKSKKNQPKLKGDKTLMLQSNHLGFLYFHQGWLKKTKFWCTMVLLTILITTFAMNGGASSLQMSSEKQTWLVKINGLSWMVETNLTTWRVWQLVFYFQFCDVTIMVNIPKQVSPWLVTICRKLFKQ
jgi:hypothetical protein